MAATFDRKDPSSPLAYSAAETGLVLCGHQGRVVQRSGEKGKAALAKAIEMRDWALQQHMTVVHAVVDVQSEAPRTMKGATRLNEVFAIAAADPTQGQMHPEIAPKNRALEHVGSTNARHVSVLKAEGIMDLLREKGTKSFIICGMPLSRVVLRSTYAALDEGFIVSVIKDACTDFQDAVQETLTKSVLPYVARVASAEEFIENWAT